MALLFGARGGVFLGGGVTERLAPLIDHRRFREAFENKGRLKPFLAADSGLPHRRGNAGAARLCRTSRALRRIAAGGRSMTERQARLAGLLEASPVVAVLVVGETAAAVPLARALVRGGVRLLEITLRSNVALAAMEAIAAQVADAIVGAGTIVSPRQFAEVENAGCRFAVSPGATPALIEAAAAASVDWLPGAATASEMMTLLEHGYRIQKFFPAEAAGGIAHLKSLASPLPSLRFCPTGGIDGRNAAAYLSLPNVLCVGGSWVAPAALVEAGKWDEISALASEAVSALKRK